MTEDEEIFIARALNRLNALTLKSQRLHTERRFQSRKTRRRKEQLRMYQEKLALMRTWKGIFRTVCQKFGIWK